MSSLFVDHDTEQLDLDDGSGLRVVSARAVGEARFDWGEMFSGFKRLRVLTYSASTKAVVGVLDNYDFEMVEVVFGAERVLNRAGEIVAFQNLVRDDSIQAILGLKDERSARLLQMVAEGRVRFWVVRKAIAHAKVYLLDGPAGRRRVVVGSANLSEQAFSGRQAETLVQFDNDELAWNLYERMFRDLRDGAANHIALPSERVASSPDVLSHVPILADAHPAKAIIIESPDPTHSAVITQEQVRRIDKEFKRLAPVVRPLEPPVRAGTQTINPKEVRALRAARIDTTQQPMEPSFSIDLTQRTAQLSGSRFPLDADPEAVASDARLLTDFFRAYEGVFEGPVGELQEDYFILMSWLYFSPFMCELRNRAYRKGEDLIRYPMFAVLYGKPNCGKTTLVETLMTSMLGRFHTFGNAEFTKTQLRALQHSYKRHPVVYDDIGPKKFSDHGRETIKNETLPLVEEYPGIVFSMNKDADTFPEDVVKRALLVYTTAALPGHKEVLRQDQAAMVRKMRSGLSGDLYRQYLTNIMDELEYDRLPADWLALSTRVLSGLLEDASRPRPHWCRTVEWATFASKRYDRIRSRLEHLLRKELWTRNEGDLKKGWTDQGSEIVVYEEPDSFGRSSFSRWSEVPSTIVNEVASDRGRTVLYRDQLEEFLDRRITPPNRRWLTIFSGRRPRA